MFVYVLLHSVKTSLEKYQEEYRILESVRKNSVGFLVLHNL